MADAIVRLRVESSEYDQKLSRATQQLQHMEKEVRRTGATFAYADKEDLEFIKSLGSMETKADSAKGKIAEMTKSFTELSLQYNRLTKEEKASPFGKTLASSLDQLKTRIKDSKSELAGVEGQLTSFGDVAKQMGAKLGIPVEQLTKFGPYGAAAAAALKVASDAFKQNEEFMDEWGRTTEAAGTVYQGFLNALNTGDLGGFLRNIGNIISKSREAYDAMDQLGTFNAFNQIQIEGARTDFTEAMANYREGSGSKEDVKAAADRLKNEMQSRQDKEQAAYIAAIKELAASRGVDEEMLQKALSGTYGDYETLKNTPLARHEEQIWNGNMYGNTTTTKVTWSADTMEQKLGEALRKLNDDELAHIQSLGAQAQRTATEIAQVDKQTVRVLGANRKTTTTSSTTTKTEEKAPEGSIKAMREQLSGLQKDWELATDDDSRKVLKDQIDEVSAALDKMIGKTKEAKPALQIEGPSGYSQEGISALRSEIQGGMKGMQMGSDEYMFQAERLVDLTAFENLLKTATANGIQPDPELLESLFEQIDNAEFSEDALKLKPSIPDEAWDELVAQINEQLEAMELPPIKLDVKTGGIEKTDKDVKALNEHVQGAIGVFGQLGSAMQQIDDPAARVAGIIMEAVASVASAFAKSLSGTVNPWEFIAASIAGVATMVSTIAAIKSATSGGFANGGIVPGNSFSGDNLRTSDYGINAGELILNRAQQGSIAGQLNSNPMSNLALSMNLKGEDIQICLDNNNRRRGRS